MAINQKIKWIRKKRNMTQQTLAKAINVTSKYISNMETGKRNISQRKLQLIRDALRIHHVPLTREEIFHLEKKLNQWKDIINTRQTEEAEKMQPELAEGAAFSCESKLQIRYYLYEAGYHRIRDDYLLLDQTLSLLASRKDEFWDNKELYFRYLCQLGIRSIEKEDNKEAAINFLEAEKIDQEIKIADEGFYINLAACFTNMGYAYKAMEYLRKANRLADESHKKGYDIIINNLMGINLNNAGKHEEALQLLRESLRLEMMKKNSTYTGSLHHNIGCVYLKKKDFAKAVSSFDAAFEHFENDRVSYIHNLYFKTHALFLDENIKAGNQCLEEGLIISKENTFLSLLFETLKHSRNLENKDSLSFVEKSVIEFDKRYEYWFAIKYCDILSRHFECPPNGRPSYMSALKYKKLSYQYYIKIMEGDTKG